MNIATLEKLEKKIDYWREQLKKSKSEVESAELSDKINKAKKEIIDLSLDKKDQEVKTVIDAPIIADKQEESNLTRGQIVDTTVDFSITL